MNLPHIVSIEYLRPEDVAADAREKFHDGYPITACPFDEGTAQAIKWREHYIACEQLYAEVE